MIEKQDEQACPAAYVWLLGLLFDPENGNITLLRNVK
jgi:hypothetical protein